MPFPQAWDNKVKVAVFPFRRDDARVCHNCWRAWFSSEFNCCTGLCEACRKMNPVEINAPKNQTTDPDKGSSCIKCGDVIKHTNFGICRNVCASCCNENSSMKRRCIICDKWGQHDWNYICHECMQNVKFLCEQTGFTYCNEDVHFRICWCLNQQYQILRKQLNEKPRSMLR